jgi:histone deacetylase 11
VPDSASPRWPSPRIVYSRHYNIGLAGMERLHPFDSRKYGRAWRLLRGRFGERLRALRVTPPRAAGREDLLHLHTPGYLARLRDPKFVARVIELPPLRYVPRVLLDYAVLRPMRWATMGTIVAAREGMAHGLAVNLAGGYHHASPDHGHGFSAYADVALAVDSLRRGGALADSDRVVYIDLDAHQGNGVCRCFKSDPRVLIYDQYNGRIFPGDAEARRRIDCDVPLPHGCGDADYLHAVRTKLPPFLDAVTRAGNVRLAIYNAGTDIYTGDRLGGLNVSAAGVLRRDQFVLDELIARRLPTVVVPSGGYSRESYRMLADMVGYAIERWA